MKIHELPFVAQTPDGLNFWSPVLGIGYEENVQAGQLAARDFVSFIRQADEQLFPFTLGYVVEAASKYPDDNGYSVGFFQEIQRQLMR